AYLPAEWIGGSGVLAVVTTGLILGQRAPRWQSAASRIAERTNWRTVQFVLENTIFVLIGLQVRGIVDAAWHTGLGHPRRVLLGLAPFGAVVLLRPIWIFPLGGMLLRKKHHARVDTALSWAGMRGVVTLAAVFVLPAGTPYRPVLVLLALVV